MTQPGASVFVIGGGIVGLSCALQAQARGFQVTIADPRGYGNGASYGNAGVIATSECLPLAAPGIVRAAPKMLLDPTGPLAIRWRHLPTLAPWLLRFAMASTQAKYDVGVRALSGLLSEARAAHGRIAREAGTEQDILDVGWLKLFETAQSFASARGEFEAMRAAGVACDFLSEQQIRDREPNLARTFRHGVLHPGCSQIRSPGMYVAALGKLFEARGGRLVRCEVKGLARQGDKVVRAITETGAFEADHFVVAAGAWSRKLAADAGAKVPLDTERGYHLVLDVRLEKPLTQPVYWAEQFVVASPGRYSVRITNGVEFATVSAKPDFTRFRRQLPALKSLFGPNVVGHVSAEWLGFRPSMPDSLPVIGRATKRSNCILAFGHGHIGLTAGPVTGEMVGQILEDEATTVDASPFSAGRFSASASFR